MKKVLLVDDDAVILKLYQDGLVRRGFQVDTVADGVAAVRALQANQPDVVVLDLMMPKLSGVDVLKFIRSQTKLADLPVVVLSNVYLSELADEAIAIGVQKAFLKTRCSPPVLADVIGELFSGETSEQPAPQPAVSSLPVPPAALATPPPTPDIQPPSPPSAAPSSPPTTAPTTRTTAIEEAVQQPAKPTGTEAFIKPRLKFLEHAPTTCAGIRKHCKAFVIAPDQVSRAERFEDFYRKVRFLTATAGFAQFHHITLLASAFEALLYDLREKPDLLTPSVLRTLTFTVDVLAELCDRARNTY
jgi:CheY-like chemotaxis protein